MDDYNKLDKDYNDLQKENTKLKSESKRMRNLQKIVDALRMNRKEITKNYQTESYSLDYLRPRDFEDDKIKNENNTYVRTKRPPKTYLYKSKVKNNENIEDDKAKSERAVLALMRIRQAQEQRRKKEE